jgi:hypothetical protein
VGHHWQDGQNTDKNLKYQLSNLTVAFFEQKYQLKIGFK